MIPGAFDYHRPSDIDAAVKLLAELGDDALIVAGGHSLIPMMKLRLAQPATLIDIGRIDELRGVEAGDGWVRVGSLTTHAELADSPQLHERCPLLAEAAAKIGDPSVRNVGTIGGNIAHADPASDLPAVLVAVGATVHLQGPNGARRLPASEFFVDLLHTAMAAGEVLTAVELPDPSPASGSAYLKVEHPASGYAVCGAAAVVTMKDGDCSSASLSFNGVENSPESFTAVTDAIVGTDAGDGVIDQAVDGNLAIADPLGDIHASGEYRVALAHAYGKRALKLARDRALA